MNRQHSLFLISALSLAVLLGAYAFQLAGYLPCHLCYIGRWAHYAVVPLGVVFALVPGLRRAGLFLLAALFLGNMVFSIWHSGIEWQWWAGPSTCTGGGGLSGAVPDFGNLTVVQCDELSSSCRLCHPSGFEFGIPVEIILPAFMQIIGREQAAIGMQLLHGGADGHLVRPHMGLSGHHAALFQIAGRAGRNDIFPAGDATA